MIQRKMRNHWNLYVVFNFLGLIRVFITILAFFQMNILIVLAFITTSILFFNVFFFFFCFNNLFIFLIIFRFTSSSRDFLSFLKINLVEIEQGK